MIYRRKIITTLVLAVLMVSAGKASADNTVIQGSDPTVENDYYPDGKISREGHLESTPQGQVIHYKSYYKDGALWGIFTTLNGTRDGIGKWYYHDGTLQTQQNYTNGVYNGLCRWYRDDGTLETQKEFKQGVMIAYKGFYMDSTLEEEDDYPSESSGVERQYTPEGKLQWEGHFSKGSFDGDFKWFNSDGSVLLSFKISPQGVENLSLNFNNDPTDRMGWTGILLLARDFDDLEIIAERLQKERVIDPNQGNWQLDYFFKGLESGFNLIIHHHEPMQIDLLNQWVAAKPQSVAALIALADAQKNQAWGFRGGDFAKSVTRERFKKFLNLLSQSEKTLDKAIALDPSSPALYPADILSLLGLGGGQATINAAFISAVVREPYYPQTYFARAISLLPRWGGAQGALEAFARQAVKLTEEKEGDGYYARIAVRSLEYVHREFINEYHFSWPKMQQGFEDLLKNYPHNLYFLSYYAWMAGQYHDQESARHAFDQIGGWNNQLAAFSSKREFEQWKQWAKGNDQPYPGETPLFLAAQKGDLQALEQLVKEGVDINKQDPDGKTALYMALENLHSDAALWLIKAGADPNTGTISDEKPIFKATELHDTDVVRLILEKSNPKDPQTFNSDMDHSLLIAASNGALDICELLVDNGAKPNTISEDNQRTPLHLAALNGQMPVVEFLLKQPSVQIDAQDSWNQTPLHEAVLAQSVPMVNLLLDAHAPKNIQDYQGKTPLDLAIGLNNKEIITILKRSFNYSMSPQFLAESYYRKGYDFYWKQHQYSVGAAYFEKAFTLDRTIKGLNYSLGSYYQTVGRTQDAVDAYKREMALDPTNQAANRDMRMLSASIYFQKGYDLYWKQQNYQKGGKYFEKAYDNDPDLKGLNYSLADYYRNNGRLKDAVEAYRREIAIDPSHPYAKQELEKTLKAMGSP